MTKLSQSLPYRLLRRWDHFCRTTLSLPRYEIWSDASGKGYGGHLGPQSHPIDAWQEAHTGLYNTGGKKGSTEYVEAKAVELSLRRWGGQLRGKRVYLYVDNYAVYEYLFVKYRSRLALGLGLEGKTGKELPVSLGIPGNCPAAKKTFEAIDHLVQAHGIQLVARWVWSKDNYLADMLSRFRKDISPHVRALLANQEKVQALVVV